MRTLRKVIAVIVMLAGMLPTIFGMMVVMDAFGYTRSEVRVAWLSNGSFILIIGAGIIFLGALIWQLGEFNAPKMAGNYFTIIGISCIIAAIINFLYSGGTGSPLLMGKEYIYLITIFFGAVGLAIGKVIKGLSNVTKSQVAS